MCVLVQPLLLYLLTEISMFLIFSQYQPEEDFDWEDRPEQSQQHHTQPTIKDAFQKCTKYDPNSHEARKLDRAVTEFIWGQVPIYTVEKHGFQEMLEKFNPRYKLPSRNYFMYKEIPRLYSETRDLITQHLREKPFYACTTDLWTSRAADTFMSITLQYITKTWEMHSWCLGCSGLNSDHDSESLREAFEEKVEFECKLDLSKMAGITTDSASNNKRAFKNDAYAWFPYFGHNLHNAFNQAISIYRVCGALSQLRKTIASFTRSPKLSCQFGKKLSELNLPGHKLIHDSATRWNSTYDMVERFLEQQQAVRVVLIEDRKKWHLMPKETGITTSEIMKDVLEPLSPFTDALSGEKNTTLSSVLPVMWKISTGLSDGEDDSVLAGQMKRAIRDYLDEHYRDEKLQLLLNTATFLDPRFKDSFVSLEDDVKQSLLEQVREAAADGALPGGPGEAGPSTSQARPSKKTKTDLKHLLSNIQGQKKGSDASATQEALPLTMSDY